MKETSLVIGGRNYISSNRASQLVGYTKDYVGQLARAGKVDSKLIGRSWYVAEDSITKHKINVHYTLTKPKKTRTKIPNDEISKDEITSKIIDNSYVSNSKNTPLSYAEIDTTEETVNFKNEEYDLFPVPKKKFEGRDDVLLHSDIYYEPVFTNTKDVVVDSEIQRPGYDESNERTTFKEGEKRTSTLISIRKEYRNNPAISRTAVRQRDRIDGTNRTRVNHLDENAYRKTPTVDGIVLHKPIHDDALQYAQDDRVNGESFPEDEDVSNYEIHNERILYERRRRSRAVPVFGALIIFCILAFLYLIL